MSPSTFPKQPFGHAHDQYNRVPPVEPLYPQSGITRSSPQGQSSSPPSQNSSQSSSGYYKQGRAGQDLNRPANGPGPAQYQSPGPSRRLGTGFSLTRQNPSALGNSNKPPIGPVGAKNTYQSGGSMQIKGDHQTADSRSRSTSSNIPVNSYSCENDTSRQNNPQLYPKNSVFTGKNVDVRPKSPDWSGSRNVNYVHKSGQSVPSPVNLPGQVRPSGRTNQPLDKTNSESVDSGLYQCENRSDSRERLSSQERNPSYSVAPSPKSPINTPRSNTSSGSSSRPTYASHDGKFFDVSKTATTSASSPVDTKGKSHGYSAMESSSATNFGARGDNWRDNKLEYVTDSSDRSATPPLPPLSPDNTPPISPLDSPIHGQSLENFPFGASLVDTPDVITSTSKKSGSSGAKKKHHSKVTGARSKKGHKISHHKSAAHQLRAGKPFSNTGIDCK